MSNRVVLVSRPGRLQARSSADDSLPDQAQERWHQGERDRDRGGDRGCGDQGHCRQQLNPHHRQAT